MTPALRCLIVDDDSGVLDIAESAGRETQFEIRIAQSAVGLQSEHLAQYDLIVLDLLMPDIDGIELLRTIESADQKPAVILMSGLGSRTLASARQLGLSKGIQVFDVLQKPFRRRELIAMLRSFASSRHASVTKPAQRKAGPTPAKAELARAIERKEIAVHLQPQINIADGTWVGVEALARWQHPEYGLLFPDAFIAMAEEADISSAFSECVLDAGLRAIQVLRNEAGFQGALSVNMAPSALGDVRLADRLIQKMDSLRLPPSLLTIEITETSVPQDPRKSKDIEVRLQMRGIKLSIDDYGTGYSSLERLHASPFDELKIDLIFVRDALRDPAARSIVENSVLLGHSMKMQTVAEGVEDAETLAWLGTLGCDVAQGYHISKPLPVIDLCHWAAKRYGRPALGDRPPLS